MMQASVMGCNPTAVVATISRHREHEMRPQAGEQGSRHGETCPETGSTREPWQFPVLPPSGGLRTDPALLRAEAAVTEARRNETDHVDGCLATRYSIPLISPSHR